MKKKTAVLLAVVVILFFTVIGYFIHTAKPSVVVIDDPFYEDGTTAKAPVTIPDETSQKEMIQVYVTGCVKNPGIYEIEKGKIMYEAILQAGGFTEDADRNIHLVYKLLENVTLRVKSINEQIGPNTQGIEIIKDPVGIVSSGQAQSTAPISSGYININTADATLLATLPGIGNATAKSIIEYRKANGPFRTIEDIMKVAGIKENKFNQIKDCITVD